MSERTLQSDPASRDHAPQVVATGSARGAPSAESAGGGGDAGAPVLFEISTEVCNQVGGIYQVIRSKAPLMMQHWGDRYCLIGPWEGAKAQVEFEESEPVGWMKDAVDEVRASGMHVHHGTWLVPGRPRVLLLEHWRGWEELGRVKYRLWQDHGIDTPGDDGLVNFVVSFAEGVRRVLSAVTRARAKAERTGGVVAHFHEWLGGLAIPMVRREELPVASVFTTHATVLGRHVAGAMDDFYDRLPWLDHEQQSRAFNCVTQHRIERAAAHGAHVFTTVSSVTAEECNYLLGRPVDVVVPNGLTIELYNAQHEQQRLHGVYKEQIHRFTMGHFFPSYTFDLEKTLYFFTSGRFEPRNKGFDLCLEAMARLNAEMKTRKIDKTVVFFIVTKRSTHSINPLAMEKRGVLNELDEVCRKITESLGQRLFTRAAGGSALQLDDLVDEYWMLRYRRAQSAFKHSGLPMVVTHILQDDSNDPVLNYIRTLGLFNRREDPVKVVYHPDFISPTNRLFGMEYDQFVRGCHMGLFPSLYEPWGYTPLECAAMGVPSVTSDTAGFGRYVQETYPDPAKAGMSVLRRRGRGYHDSAADLCSMLVDFCGLERRDRIALRNEVDRRSWDFDWAKLGRAYHTAHELAIARLAADDQSQWADPARDNLSGTDPKPAAEVKPASQDRAIGMVSADDLARLARGGSESSAPRKTPGKPTP